jgi:hypothetical protein
LDSRQKTTRWGTQFQVVFQAVHLTKPQTRPHTRPLVLYLIEDTTVLFADQLAAGCSSAATRGAVSDMVMRLVRCFSAC